MLTIRKFAASTLVALAGLGGLLVAAVPGAVLVAGATATSDVSVLADSPWDSPPPEIVP